MKFKNLLLTLLFLGVLSVSFAQELIVSGIVKDEDMNPMLGVSVMIKGTTHGIATDVNGSYSLKVQLGDILEFSSIGYKTQSHKVTSQTQKLDVALQLDIKEMDELVFVGFGQKRAVKELTGSVGKTDKLSNSNVASVDKALNGKIAGVQGNSYSGQPGGSANIRIRGVASINGRTEPIYIVDGVRIKQGELAKGLSGVASSNILANLNDEDIESITVLKDAVSTAVYGADAGAGVVIITTKAGKKGEAKYSFSSEVGMVSRAVKGEENLSTSEWLDMIYDAYLNTEEGTSLFPNHNKEALLAQLAAGGFSDGLGKTIQGLYNKRHINTDWRKEIENPTALMQKVNGSVSGGNDRFDYYASLGYYNLDGIIKQTGFQRVTNTNRFTYHANDRLTLATDLQLSYGKMLTKPFWGYPSNPVLALYYLQPTDRAYLPNGSLNLGNDSGLLSNGYFNAAALLRYNYMQVQTARAFGNFQADYKLWDKLTYKFVFAPEYIDIMEDIYNSPIHGDGYSYGGTTQANVERYFSFNIQNILSYNFQYKEKHNFELDLIQEAYRTETKSLSAKASQVGPSGLTTLSNFIKPSKIEGTKEVSSREGYALMAHYDYDKFFLLDLSGRQDRVSHFWGDNKTGYFGSVGVGVDFAQLDAVKNWDKLSQLKLSTSYGSVGNMVEVLPYATLSYLQNYNDKVGGSLEGVENRDLRWEVLYPFNIGLDLGFWEDRLTLSAAYFHKTTADMIFEVPLPSSQGPSSVGAYRNIGKMVNQGVELSFRTQLIDNEGEGFRWNLGANFTTLENKVTQLYKNKDVISDENIMREGEPANAFYLKKWAGVDPQNGEPLWYLNGQDGATTNDYTLAQYAVQGNLFPTYYGGVDSELSYKNFTLAFDFVYSGGNKIRDIPAPDVNSDGASLLNYPGYRSQRGNYWTPQHRAARDPKPILGQGNKNANSASTRYLYKADYIQLQSLRLSYSLKPEFLAGTYLKGLEFYLLGNNLWTYNFDPNYKGDNSSNELGNFYFPLPMLKTYSFGINVNL